MFTGSDIQIFFKIKATKIFLYKWFQHNIFPSKVILNIQSWHHFIFQMFKVNPLGCFFFFARNV